MKKITIKSKHVLLLAGLCVASLTFSACDTEDVLPAEVSTPTTPGTPTTPSTPTTPTTPGNPTTPGTPTTPSTPTTPTTPPVTTNSLLKEFDFHAFQYNAQQKVVSLDIKNMENAGYRVVYEGDKPVKLLFDNRDYLIFTYEGDKAVKGIVYSPEHKVNFDYTFEYSGDKLVKLTTLTYVGISSPRGHLSIIDFKYDANGNLTETVLVWSPSNSPDDMRGPTVVKWGDYDSKPNPIPFYIGNRFYLPGIKMSVNNPGYRQVYNHKSLYTYTYHDSGMPKTRTLKLEEEPTFAGYTATFYYE